MDLVFRSISLAYRERDLFDYKHIRNAQRDALDRGYISHAVKLGEEAKNHSIRCGLCHIVANQEYENEDKRK